MTRDASTQTRTARVVTIEWPKSTLRERIAWHIQQAKLRIHQPSYTTDEWYAAGCPSYYGQKPPWKPV